MSAPNAIKQEPASPLKNSIVQVYQHCLRNLPREHGFEPLLIDGFMPGDLRGTLYLNGPGYFTLFDHAYQHWFDGDGAMTAIHFGNTVTGAVRMVESRQLIEERKAGRALYTTGSTRAPDWWRRLGLRFKNVANTKPLYWNDRLFALFEAGLPTELDPATLQTLGETDLDGTITGFFSAHFHAVASRRTAYNFSIKRGRKPVLHLYEIPEGGAMRRLGSIPIPPVAMLHDFIATDNHLVFFIPPTRMPIIPVVLGLKAPLEAMQWRPQEVGSSRVDLQACKLEYSIVSPK